MLRKKRDLCKMKTNKPTQQEISHQLYSLVVPEEILKDFEITQVKESSESITIQLLEKKDQTPTSEQELVQNGYMNPIEIQGFPIQGKPCYYKLTRRRWKEKGTSKDWYNTYSYTIEGSKTTQKFGSFLKELGE